ncbi:MAG: hypothetical protein HY240_04560, partial [Actinobacteria bacterium]|nr:hypothetical protein [Actinomycetota bacterium]MBI3648007.1 hypothetical protein [Actinomycetota bacterium]
TVDDRVQLSSVARSSSRICTELVDSAIRHRDAVRLLCKGTNETEH